MKKQVFNTNINCPVCVKTVTPVLDSLKNNGLIAWSIDTTKPEKPLTVIGDVTRTQIELALQEVGFGIKTP